MKINHYDIRIFGWKKRRFFSVSEDRMFFHVGGCPAQAPCEVCEERVAYVKSRFKHLGIVASESLTPSGYLCFGFNRPAEATDPVQFMEKLLEARVLVINNWQSEISSPEEGTNDPSVPGDDYEGLLDG